MQKSFAPPLRASSIFLAALLLAPCALADRLITTSGKVLEGKIREEGDTVFVQFENATLELAKKFVKQIEIEGDMSSYVPKDEREKEMLAKGFVKYRGQWLSKDRYANELKAQEAAARKKLEEIRLRQQWGNEWTKEKKLFVFHSNTSPEILNEYVSLFEDFYAFYSQKFSIQIAPTMARHKMDVNIFRNRADYLEYSKKPTSAGYFSWSDFSLNLYYDSEDPAFTQMVLFHEGTHMINYLLNPTYFVPVPIWLKESMAEYYGNTSVEITPSGKRKFTVGVLNEYRLGVVQEGIARNRVLGIEKILTTQQSSFDADHYAFAWSFVYFLANHAKYGKGFFRFFADIYDGKGMKFEDEGNGKKISNEEVKRALLKYIGAKDIATLEKEWIEYVKTLEIKTGAGFYNRARNADLRAKPQEGETRAGDASDALTLLDKAIDELDYKTSKAYFLRAVVRLLRGDRDKSLADLEAAIGQDPLNPRLYAARAFLKNLEEKYPEAENDLQLAIALDPEQEIYPRYLSQLRQKKWKAFPEVF